MQMLTAVAIINANILEAILSNNLLCLNQNKNWPVFALDRV